VIAALPALLALLAVPAAADEIVYGEALAEGWYSWSWTGNFNFNATEEVHSGQFSIYAGVNEYGALSLYKEGGFQSASALSFWIEGDDPPIALVLEAVGFQQNTTGVPIDELAEAMGAGAWDQVIVPLDDLPPLSWSRFDLVDYSGVGASFHVDDVYLLELDPTATSFTAAEPLGERWILLDGAGDAGAVSVTLGGQPLAVARSWTSGGPTRTYLELEAPLEAGALVVSTGDGAFERGLEAVALTLGEAPTHEISPAIYGANFPEGYPGEQVLDWLGVTSARWGGNATAMYNPERRATSLGADWYYMNEGVATSPSEWLEGISQRVDATVLTVPNLGWVASDGGSWAFSVDKYGDQEEVAPGEEDAGNGVLAGGTVITWNDPTDAAIAWDPEQAYDWLAGMGAPPTVAAIGNETDISDRTHRATHPEPVTYEEQLTRFLDYSAAVKDALPDTLVSGPVSCCWTYYWTSAAGEEDRQRHGGQDFLPWFLDEVAAADDASGRRSLDLLDLHYYPEGVFSDEVDERTAALRLRSTRSLWDPEYVDESYIGDAEPVPAEQPDPDRVTLIPRMKALLEAHYPGTGLAISEWSWGAPEDLSGGLAAADVLGIFGREGVEMAMYWPAPVPGTPVAGALRLFLDEALPFGAQSVPVSGFDPDRLGVYAALDGEERLTVVAVNKDPGVDFLLTGLPGGIVWTRHFGGAVGARVVQHPEAETAGGLVVPAYSAVAVVIEPIEGDTPIEDSGIDVGDTGSDGPGIEAGSGGRGCGCGGGSAGWLLLLLPWWRRRR
jgi:hypothetical protein